MSKTNDYQIVRDQRKQAEPKKSTQKPADKK